MRTLEIEVEETRPVAAWCDDRALTVELVDGRKVVTPLWWYPTLLAATPEQRNRTEMMVFGVHWPELDEDLSVAGMLRGAKAPKARKPEGWE